MERNEITWQQTTGKLGQQNLFCKNVDVKKNDKCIKTYTDCFFVFFLSFVGLLLRYDNVLGFFCFSNSDVNY